MRPRLSLWEAVGIMMALRWGLVFLIVLGVPIVLIGAISQVGAPQWYSSRLILPPLMPLYLVVFAYVLGAAWAAPHGRRRVARALAGLLVLIPVSILFALPLIGILLMDSPETSAKLEDFLPFLLSGTLAASAGAISAAKFVSHHDGEVGAAPEPAAGVEDPLRSADTEPTRSVLRMTAGLRWLLPGVGVVLGVATSLIVTTIDDWRWADEVARSEKESGWIVVDPKHIPQRFDQLAFLGPRGQFGTLTLVHEPTISWVGPTRAVASIRSAARDSGHSGSLWLVAFDCQSRRGVQMNGANWSSEDSARLLSRQVTDANLSRAKWEAIPSRSAGLDTASMDFVCDRRPTGPASTPVSAP